MFLESVGLRECSDAERREVVNFVRTRMGLGSGKLHGTVLPNKSRINAALLGSFPVHQEITVYGVKSNLQEAIESKINKEKGRKIVVAVNTLESVYSAATETFSYRQLVELKNQTYAVDFLVFSFDRDSFFIFHEDDPACILSCGDSNEFGKDFMDQKSAARIFERNMMEWRITSLPSQSEWLAAVLQYFSST